MKDTIMSGPAKQKRRVVRISPTGPNCHLRSCLRKRPSLMRSFLLGSTCTSRKGWVHEVVLERLAFTRNGRCSCGTCSVSTLWTVSRDV
ncbi:hypothetical protein DPMN_010086 [Dreissena polymorpha]|uniref:Uncharacterized protein n=1 Tax=Dreissena polymorpha TaxID=45954 RepID=A0A9D4MZA0_DREPO|nr:hypothetical protein DPMN_010086 [Dreissena polymorpha]